MNIEMRWLTYETATVRDSDGHISRVTRPRDLQFRVLGGSREWITVENDPNPVPAEEWYSGEYGKLLNR